MDKLFVFVAVVFLLPMESVFAQAGESGADNSRFHIGLEVGSRWEDNIGLAPDDTDPEFVGDDEIDDLTLSLAVNLSYDLVRRQGQEFSVSVTPFYNHVDDLDGLSNWGLIGGLEYRGEFGPAFTDPWYSISASYTVTDFDDSRIREGDWFEAEASIGKRFSPRFGISGGARWLDRSQDNDDRLCPNRLTSVNCPGNWREDQVFEQERWGVFVHADWFFSDKTSLFFEYSYWDGDEDSTAPLRGGVDPGWLNNQDVFADDPAFGQALFVRSNGIPRPLRDFVVWRIEAKQHVYEIGVRQALTDKISVELVGAFMETSDVRSPDRVTRPEGVDNYRNTAVMATFSFSLR